MLDVKQMQIIEYAKSIPTVPIIVKGAAGTGKSLVAAAIARCYQQKISLYEKPNVGLRYIA